ncbi:hypothetical protein [Vibrio hepatarius]|uniref:Copper-binding protein n=1 Tax=Vibrio hepatarius TaxID=171383 RepID=A0A0M0I0C6_9VIBR|nr:hypothetical protein [Vibrio hepatarius]KOO07527.1 hypothetical protein AKJ31_11605 [Vibrio hepatarius]NOI14395.1 hypothetical protein [Vibrio hepatarius]
MPSLVKILLLVVALCAGFFAGDVYEKLKSQVNTVSLDDYCLLSSQPCIQDGVSITVDRDVSQPLIPTHISVEWPQTNASELLLKLEGHEMEMGTAVFKLTKSPNGAFTGDVILPVCTTEEMTWVGELSDGQQNIKTSLRMER